MVAMVTISLLANTSVYSQLKAASTSDTPLDVPPADTPLDVPPTDTPLDVAPADTPLDALDLTNGMPVYTFTISYTQ